MKHLIKLFIVVTAFCVSLVWAKHPSLILNNSDIALMQTQGAQYPLFAKSMAKVKREADKALANPITVPYPKDAGGGYTHEQHKRNNKALLYLGLQYQLSGNAQYANRARDMLLEYAALYPQLGEHPKKKEQTPGRLFWQSLNEAVWLVYVAQAYDLIYTSLTVEQRQTIENGVLLPMAQFLSVGQPQTFNKIHNHGTWAVAAVGMLGIVLDKKELVQQALYGLDQSGQSGFLKQIDTLFSPDGYYEEGPYYQRYAIMPFVLFAAAIDNHKPELGLFEYRDGVLLKAIEVLFQLSYNGKFFAINDAIKEKGIRSPELVHALALAYAKTKNPGLLSLAQKQKYVDITSGGFAMARDIAKNKAQPFDFKTMLLKDGTNGDKGGLAILRSNPQNDAQVLVVKNTSQGQGHGHFDKLSYIFYDAGYEIISDYGAARFVNVESKYGGHYLPENNKYAKQTVAHNTVVVDATSHFNAKTKVGSKHSPKILLFEDSTQIKIVSAVADNTYQGVRLVRTMAQITVPTISHPIVLDVFRIDSTNKHQYDLPIHFNGHIINTNFDYKANSTKLKPLGSKNGYQYLWNLAQGTPKQELVQLTWLQNMRFYTVSMLNNNTDYIFTRLGANDPNFNLTAQQAIIQRVKKQANYTFVNVIEPHGKYDYITESTLRDKSQVVALQLLEQADVDVVSVTFASGVQLQLALSYSHKNKTYKVDTAKGSVQWSGFYQLFINN